MSVGLDLIVLLELQYLRTVSIICNYCTLLTTVRTGIIHTIILHALVLSLASDEPLIPQQCVLRSTVFTNFLPRSLHTVRLIFYQCSFCYRYHECATTIMTVDYKDIAYRCNGTLSTTKVFSRTEPSALPKGRLIPMIDANYQVR